MVKSNSLFKSKAIYLAVLFLIVILTFSVFRGKVFSDRINKNGALCYGIISEDKKPMTYYYKVDGKLFKGNINSQNGRNKIGDTLIIQYNIDNPTLHIVHSKKGNTKLKMINKKVVSIWDAM